MKATRWIGVMLVAAMSIGFLAALGSTGVRPTAAPQQVVPAKKTPPGPVTVATKVVTKTITAVRRSAPKIVARPPRQPKLTDLRPCSRRDPVPALDDQSVAEAGVKYLLRRTQAETDGTRAGSTLQESLSLVEITWDFAHNAAEPTEEDVRKFLIEYVGRRLVGGIHPGVADCPVLVVDVIDFLLDRLSPQRTIREDDPGAH